MYGNAKNLQGDIERAFRGFSESIKPKNDSYVVEGVDVSEILERLAGFDVLVGLPAEDKKRDGNLTNPQIAFLNTFGVRTAKMRKSMDAHVEQQRGRKSYSKAYQAYIHTHGSPAWRIPPRPFLEPAIEANAEKIAHRLQQAAIRFLEGHPEDGISTLKLAGIMSRNFVYRWFDDARNGWAPNAPLTIRRKGSDHPLIDTGEMRKSITYVLRETQKNPKYRPAKGTIRRLDKKRG